MFKFTISLFSSGKLRTVSSNDVEFETGKGHVQV